MLLFFPLIKALEADAHIVINNLLESLQSVVEAGTHFISWFWDVPVAPVAKHLNTTKKISHAALYIKHRPYKPAHTTRHHTTRTQGKIQRCRRTATKPSPTNEDSQTASSRRGMAPECCRRPIQRIKVFTRSHPKDREKPRRCLHEGYDVHGRRRHRPGHDQTRG